AAAHVSHIPHIDDFHSGFAGLGLQSQASPQLQHNDNNTGVSPREVIASGRNMASPSSGGGQIMYQDPFNSSSQSEQARSRQTEFLLDLEDDIEAGMATICALPVSRSSGGARIGLQLLGTQSHLRGDAVMHSRNVVRGEMRDGHASAAVESAIRHHLIRRLMKQDRRPSLYTTFIGCAKPNSPVLG
ncbi:hypothetical protein FRB97_004273, partial [Tulasnella sp. 331]